MAARLQDGRHEALRNVAGHRLGTAEVEFGAGGAPKGLRGADSRRAHEANTIGAMTALTNGSVSPRDDGSHMSRAQAALV